MNILKKIYTVDRDKRLTEFKEQIFKKGYNEEMVQSSIDKVKKMAWNVALKRVQGANQKKRQPNIRSMVIRAKVSHCNLKAWWLWGR